MEIAGGREVGQALPGMKIPAGWGLQSKSALHQGWRGGGGGGYFLELHIAINIAVNVYN